MGNSFCDDSLHVGRSSFSSGERGVLIMIHRVGAAKRRRVSNVHNILNRIEKAK